MLRRPWQRVGQDNVYVYRLIFLLPACLLYLPLSLYLCFFHPTFLCVCLERDTTIEAKFMFSWLFRRESDHWGNDEGSELPSSYPGALSSLVLTPLLQPFQRDREEGEMKEDFTKCFERKRESKSGKGSSWGEACMCVCVCWGNRLRALKMQWHKSGLCWVSCFFIGLFPVVLSLKLLPLSLHSFCSQSRGSWMMLGRCQTSGFERERERDLLQLSDFSFSCPWDGLPCVFRRSDDWSLLALYWSRGNQAWCSSRDK